MKFTAMLFISHVVYLS